MSDAKTILLNRGLLLLVLLMVACSDANKAPVSTAPRNDTLKEFFIPATPEKAGHIMTHGRVCYFDNVNESEAAIDLSLEIGDAREND